MKLLIYEFVENEPGTEELMANLLDRYGKPMWTDGDVKIVTALEKVKEVKVCRNCRKNPVTKGRSKYCSDKCMRSAIRKRYYRKHGR